MIQHQFNKNFLEKKITIKIRTLIQMVKLSNNGHKNHRNKEVTIWFYKIFLKVSFVEMTSSYQESASFSGHCGQ